MDPVFIFIILPIIIIIIAICADALISLIKYVLDMEKNIRELKKAFDKYDTTKKEEKEEDPYVDTITVNIKNIMRIYKEFETYISRDYILRHSKKEYQSQLNELISDFKRQWPDISFTEEINPETNKKVCYIKYTKLSFYGRWYLEDEKKDISTKVFLISDIANDVLQIRYNIRDYMEQKMRQKIPQIQISDLINFDGKSLYRQ